MKILLAGGSGYIGRALVSDGFFSGSTYRIIRTAGDKNVVTLLYPSGALLTAGNWQEIKQQVAAIGFDAIINLAASTLKESGPEFIDDLVEANVTFSSKLAWLARESAISCYIFASTFSIDADRSGYSPQTFYAATKKMAEDGIAYFSDGSFTQVNLRYFDIYGPDHHRNRLIPMLSREIREGAEITLEDQGLHPIKPVHLEDAIMALKHAVELSKNLSIGPHTFQVSGNETNPREVAEVIMRLKGVSIGKVSFASKKARNPKVVWDLPSKPPVLPGWAPRISLDEGLRRIVAEN